MTYPEVSLPVGRVLFSQTAPSETAVKECTVFVINFLKLYPTLLADYAREEITTWFSAGLVLFAASFLGTRNSEALGTITKFSPDFIKLTIRITDMDDWWKSEELNELASTLCAARNDLAAIYESYANFQEHLFRRLTPQFSAWLHTARAGILYNGVPETPDQYSEE